MASLATRVYISKSIHYNTEIELVKKRATATEGPVIHYFLNPYDTDHDSEQVTREPVQSQSCMRRGVRGGRCIDRYAIKPLSIDIDVMLIL